MNVWRIDWFGFDWEPFAQRVAPGTPIRLIGSQWADEESGEATGILLENKPYRQEEQRAAQYTARTWELNLLTAQLFDRVSPFTYPVFGFEYQVDGEWLTFEKIMGEETQPYG